MRRNIFVEKFNVAASVLYSAEPALPMIRDSLRLQFSDYEVTHMASGLKLKLDPRRGDWFTFYECCIRQDYFFKELRLEEGANVLDIGGNFGAFSLLAALKVGPTGRVHCYEPSPDSMARIKSHVELNGVENISLYQSAVGGVSGHISFFIHDKSALSSTKEVIDGRNMKDLQKIEVQQVAISEVLSKVSGEIALAKIDCEGAEYEIMDKLSDSDLRRIKALVMETHKVPGRSRAEILEKLRDNRFEIRDGNPFVAWSRDT